MKDAGDYVTETDVASEHAIARSLASTGIPVVGEETAERSTTDIGTWISSTWLRCRRRIGLARDRGRASGWRHARAVPEPYVVCLADRAIY